MIANWSVLFEPLFDVLLLLPFPPPPHAISKALKVLSVKSLQK
ncbi:hypothetical protein L313_2068 [Acinetobacter haemolyticus CIP 64.3 = MTCC 9819]|nr:hypothetical protein L313_2068 [Acinetobacter haemolyticus CIP 64.3 = MTCC 9819]